MKNLMKDMRKMLGCAVTIQIWSENGIESKTYSIISDTDFFDMLLKDYPNGTKRTIVIGDKVFEEKGKAV